MPSSSSRRTQHVHCSPSRPAGSPGASRACQRGERSAMAGCVPGRPDPVPRGAGRRHEETLARVDGAPAEDRRARRLVRPGWSSASGSARRERLSSRSWGWASSSSSTKAANFCTARAVDPPPRAASPLSLPPPLVRVQPRGSTTDGAIHSAAGGVRGCIGPVRVWTRTSACLAEGLRAPPRSGPQAPPRQGRRGRRSTSYAELEHPRSRRRRSSPRAAEDSPKGLDRLKELAGARTPTGAWAWKP